VMVTLSLAFSMAFSEAAGDMFLEDVETIIMSSISCQWYIYLLNSNN
jgi:hypothetical protein